MEVEKAKLELKQKQQCPHELSQAPGQTLNAITRSEAMNEEIPCALAGCPSGKKIIIFLTVYYIVLAMVLAIIFTCLWASLQEAIHTAGGASLLDNLVATIGTQNAFSVQIVTIGEARYLIIPDSYAIMAVSISGAFGGLIHGLRSFYFHVFKGDLKQAEVIRLLLQIGSAHV